MNAARKPSPFAVSATSCLGPFRSDAGMRSAVFSIGAGSKPAANANPPTPVDTATAPARIQLSIVRPVFMDS